MTVKMLHSMSGTDFSVAPGDATNVFDEAEEARLIERGYAEPATGEGTNQQSGGSTPNAPAVVNFAKLKNKAEIVAKAKEVHGLELDPAKTVKELLAAIDEHVAKASA